jgi:hypothetical protein
MSESVLTQAKDCNFTCQLTVEGNWQIFSSQSKETWRLLQVEDRWLLSANGVAQVYLTIDEAIAFLKRRHQALYRHFRGGVSL